MRSTSPGAKRCTVSTDDQSKSGEVFAPGSPEDVQQMLQVLNTFFTEKVKSVGLFQNGQAQMANSTGGTYSACNSDGTNDGDGKEPDV